VAAAAAAAAATTANGKKDQHRLQNCKGSLYNLNKDLSPEFVVASATILLLM
jgi:hypothetical protein